ncbi:MAG: NYN domain-containing protein [Syntrophobacteraceae bacterium]|jgi:uncharacterized LabA/DUF88 family protein
MAEDTVIFFDGEYVRKIFQKQDMRANVPLLISKIMEDAGIPPISLLRVYYYTSAPYQSENPTLEEKSRYKQYQKFVQFLEQQESIEIRYGRLEKRGDSFSQKMVDVLLSIDLVELSAKARIKTAILVAGDSDFVPAVKKAKDNGVKVILVCSNKKNEYHQNLWKAADKRYLLSEERMAECCFRKQLGTVLKT